MEIIFVLIVVVLILAVSFYNQLIRSKAKVLESFSGIDVALEKRYSVLMNLNETVKAAAKHEENVLIKLVQCRSSMTLSEKESLNEQYNQTEKVLLAIAEAYPELKVNQNFIALQKAIVDCEEHLQAARRFYNANVSDYNVKIDAFPTNLFASMMNLEKARFFETENRDLPKVNF